MSGKVLNFLIIVEVAALLAAAGVWANMKLSDASGSQGQESSAGYVGEIPQVAPAEAVSQSGEVADDFPVTPILDEIGQEARDAAQLAISQNCRVNERYYPPVDPKEKKLGILSNPSIVVEKSKLRLWIFDGDKPVKCYRAAVGANPGHKYREGDMRTPEGDYYVCVRKTTPDTPYVRSLGLSFPDVDDARKALAEGRISQPQHNAIVRAIANRTSPPWNTPLGGAIMIHGKRDSRRQTLGCIALDDDDVIELYPQISLGTPVRIIP